jgi:predicted dehydrogenase
VSDRTGPGPDRAATGERRAAIVGTGSRARLYTRGLASRDQYTVAALCDPSPTRMAYHNRLLAAFGAEPGSAVAS